MVSRKSSVDGAFGNILVDVAVFFLMWSVFVVVVDLVGYN